MSTIYSLSLPSLSEGDLRFYHENGKSVCQARVFPAHTDTGTEIYVLEEGETTFRVERDEYPLTAGDVLFSRPGEVHNCILPRASIHRHFCFWPAPSMEPVFDGLSAFCGASRRISLPREQKQELLSLCASIQEAAEQQDRLLVLCRFLSLVRLCGGHPPTTDKEQYPARLHAILTDMAQSYANAHGLAYFSKKHFISQSTLNRLFQQWLHTSPGRYLEELRLTRARALLNQGKSVLDAGSEVGFMDCSGFIRLFKARFGITPAAYRRLGCGASGVLRYTDRES